MAKSITSINSLLVNLKTINSTLLVKLQQLGFDTSLALGAEQEYTVKSLVFAIDTLTIQFLTITAKRNQFIQRTSYSDRKDIETCLLSLQECLQQTQKELNEYYPGANLSDPYLALTYTDQHGAQNSLRLLDAVHYIDQMKPYGRMLEMVIAQERIHALSAVLETLLSKDQGKEADEEPELTDEQSSALELSQYLIRQAL